MRSASAFQIKRLGFVNDQGIDGSDLILNRSLCLGDRSHSLPPLLIASKASVHHWCVVGEQRHIPYSFRMHLRAQTSMKRRYLSSICLIAAIALQAFADTTTQTRDEYAANDDWPYYHGNPAQTHFSRLSDINTSNVSRLRVAWTYDTRDELTSNSTMESNPLIIDGRLFFVSPKGRVICLDGATGAERWSFSPPAQVAPLGFRRGVSYWSDGSRSRIFYIFGRNLYAIDAETGGPAESFGSKGVVALGSTSSSPGAIYRDLYIIGGSASSIRAFSARSGELRWTFNTIPRPGEFGHETWPKDAWKTAVGVNNWPGMAVDVARGLAFVSLAYPQDYYGGDRPGDNLFANSVVALDASTGQRVWHFQTIRHDLWDRDLAAPPNLVTVVRNGKPVDAVAQISKHGFVYLLDRLTGKSLFPLTEESAVASDVPGEATAKTQIRPVLPEPFARQHLTEDLLTRRTPAAAAAVTEQFSKLRSRGLWDPPSEQGTVMLPGMDGGGEWGGASYDPTSNLLYVNSSEMPWILKLKRVALGETTSGRSIYQDHCASCHGEDRAGKPPEIPSLTSVASRLSFYDIVQKIGGGGGRMPAFRFLSTDQAKLWLLVAYVQTGADSLIQNTKSIEPSNERKDAFVLDGMPRFVDPDGYPAIAPPWGTLNAIDLNTGRYAWKIPLGEHPELVSVGVRNTGSENYGGSIVTGGGILFIAATSFDKKFRAFDKRNGSLLWESTLPAAGNATPATYRAKGKQYVVIAAGGGRPATAQSGSKLVAFSLPD
ncbi:pyrroloquinoline quinone-dependent dehydrogenase [Steroidobacter flavus]|uniref:Pyrroloquinoline quinone-dependent dehydrogenase n=1 Tax=Steroidobacter flavus TaxID=1842136 RepID=A0ABV8T260_9GAMM